ncbi:MAG: glutathione peroxidase [Sedimentisphaerales bacterium]|nr:glutathione peroxidase [Sedimentisphaerales bacterium]
MYGCKDTSQQAADEPSAHRAETVHQEPAAKLYTFNLTDMDGNLVSLAQYKGKVLLLVNVASKCGFTKQYEGLQKLYETYKDSGLVVLAFPANNFGNQEPGTNEEIRQFCTANFRVTFPLFAKISAKGDDIHPLYAWLTDPEANAPYGGPIQWNFNKFLIGRDGNCVGRYDSPIEPMSDSLRADIEKVLEKTVLYIPLSDGGIV